MNAQFSYITHSCLTNCIHNNFSGARLNKHELALTTVRIRFVL